MGSLHNGNPYAILSANFVASVANGAWAPTAKSFAPYPFSPGGSSLFFSGYYLSAMWFLTGESKALSYQVDDNSNGGHVQASQSSASAEPRRLRCRRPHRALERGRPEQRAVPGQHLQHPLRLGTYARGLLQASPRRETGEVFSMCVQRGRILAGESPAATQSLISTKSSVPHSTSCRISGNG